MHRPIPARRRRRYQDALDRICGGRTKAGHKLEVPASLVLEYGGPHAPKAIRVDIDGQTVGYVERKAARTLWQKVAEAGLTSEAVTCDAIIVGGWDRGEGDSGFRGCPTRSARRTTDRPACAKGPLCVSTDSYPDRVTTAWIERQLLFKVVVRDDEIIA